MSFNEYLKEALKELSYIVTYNEGGKDKTMSVKASSSKEALSKARESLSADRVAKVIKAELDTRQREVG